jgi:putative transposase
MSKINYFKYYKTSPEIIKLAVMYYIRYPLSLRQVEDILHERGIDICHETIRYWWNKFGSLFSKEMKKKSRYRASNWRWHIDEVFVKINGETHYLWRAVDQEGTILDCYVSKRRNRKAARKVLKKLVSRHGKPKQIVTDKLPSYKAALRELSMQHLQETRQYANNQVENSHLHFRRREKIMNKFRSMRSLQKFVSFQSAFLNHFNHQRHLETRQTFKKLRDASLAEWQEVFMG